MSCRAELAAQLEKARAEVLDWRNAASRSQDEAETSKRLAGEWSKKADIERKRRMDMSAQNAELLEAQKTWERQKR